MLYFGLIHIASFRIKDQGYDKPNRKLIYNEYQHGNIRIAFIFFFVLAKKIASRKHQDLCDDINPYRVPSVECFYLEIGFLQLASSPVALDIDVHSKAIVDEYT
jgi:hypothetical protein